MYYANRSKTTEAREWSCNILHHLSSTSNAKSLSEARSYFDKKIHCIQTTIIAYYPKEKVITLKGDVSNKSFDTTNIEKPLIDLIFLPKYFDKEYPYGCKNLNVDDKFLLDCYSKKRISPDGNHYIKVIIEIKDREDFFKEDLLEL